MRRKTQEKPHKFKHGEETFKTEKLGFLVANELLLKYMPKLFKIFKQFQSDKTKEQLEKEAEAQTMDLDIGAIIAEVGPNTLTVLAEDLFQRTWVAEPDGSWATLDADCFESHSEMFTVAKEVFTYNYPDFFKGDNDTEEHKVSQNTITAPSKTINPISSSPEEKIVKL